VPSLTAPHRFRNEIDHFPDRAQEVKKRAAKPDLLRLSRQQEEVALRASDIVRQLCVAVAGRIHRARWQLMLAIVDGLLRCHRLSLTALGRSLGGGVAAKHRIKRLDRFIGNFRTHGDIVLWYGALSRRLLRNNRRPVVLIDWTQTIGAFNALVAAVAFTGRAIPIYAEVHPSSKLGNRKVQQSFLWALAALLPRARGPSSWRTPGSRRPSSVQSASTDGIS
jgi:hypothetical protein